MMQCITGNMDESLADLGVESMKIEERDPPSVEALRRTTRTDFLKDLPARMEHGFDGHDPTKYRPIAI